MRCIESVLHKCIHMPPVAPTCRRPVTIISLPMPLPQAPTVDTNFRIGTVLSVSTLIGRVLAIEHDRRMVWTVIRLELARTPEFPEGSAARAYLLRLPLDALGMIDASAFEASPQLATVRRYWPNERDKEGYVLHKRRNWVFSYAPGEEDDEALFHLETHPIRLGEFVTVTETDGERLPFRVVRCE